MKSPGRTGNDRGYQLRCADDRANCPRIPYGGAKVRIDVVDADLGGKLEAKNTQVSRIQFSVPILMPKNPRDWAKEHERGHPQLVG